MEKIELLAPAGSFESLTAAINNGADAVYLGGSRFSARAYASNFDNETMQKAVDYAHSYGVKIYVTINTLLKQEELKEALKYAGYLYEIGVDALIIQDTGLINLIEKYYPDFELHASTQMTIHNAEGALYYTERGFKRIVLSRELTLEEIRHISKDLNIETEIFVHGALCVCYSGQCLMSSMIGGRSGNRGRCAQSCRMQYTLKGENTEKKKGYLLSPKDTCFIDDIENIEKSGAASLKIEGRMKKPEYVAGVARAYRGAIDAVEKNKKYNLKKGRRNLMQLFNREGFAKAYLYKNVGKDMMSMKFPKNTGVFLGKVLGNGEVVIEEDIELGDGIRFNEEGFTLSKILLNGKEVKNAVRGSKVKLFPQKGLKKGVILYKTSSRALAEELKDETKLYKRKINLTAEAEFEIGKPVVLKVKFNGKEYKAYGDAAEEAAKSPLTKERIAESLKKSGDVPYKIDKVKFTVFEDGFIRISSLNSLRRNLFDEILKDTINSYRRKRVITPELEAAFDNLSENIKNKNQNAEAGRHNAAQNSEKEKTEFCLDSGIIYSCITKEQFKILAEDKEVLNIAPDIFYSRNHRYINKQDVKETAEKYGLSKNIFIKVPEIIKEEFDAVCRSIDELKPFIKGIITSNAGIIRKYKDEMFIIGDYKLNVFNNESLEYYKSDIEIPSLSLELNRRELKDIAKRLDSDTAVNIYGKTELMISEYCAVGSCFGGKSASKECSAPCMKDEFTLTDRMNTDFKIMCDNFCRTHIMNNPATNLCEEISELESFGYKYFRADFTDESCKETIDVLNQIKIQKKNNDKVYTKGHYKRGVE